MMGGNYANHNFLISRMGQLVIFPAEITLLDSSDGRLVVMTTERTYVFSSFEELEAFGRAQQTHQEARHA